MSYWVIYITNNTIALVAQKEMISINYLAEKKVRLKNIMNKLL